MAGAAANVNERIAGLSPYQPGKPVEELAREAGIENIVKLASNENPRGPGPAVRAAKFYALRIFRLSSPFSHTIEQCKARIRPHTLAY